MTKENSLEFKTPISHGVIGHLDEILENIEKDPGYIAKPILTGLALVVAGSINPKLLEAAFYTQPLTVEQGYRIATKTVRDILEGYALKVAKYGSLYSQE